MDPFTSKIFNRALSAIAQNAAHPSRCQKLMPMLFHIVWTA